MSEERGSSNEAAWNLAAKKYEADLDRDVELLRSGGVSLDEVEVDLLGELTGCSRAVHLLCSHGQDALSLLNLGAHEVIGVDFSTEMLRLAEEKTERLGARASFTGKGALPWIVDLDRWAHSVVNLLRPDGRFLIYEGHPLNWVWDPTADSHRLRASGRTYFDEEPRANDTFPASAVERYSPGESPAAWERQWTLGKVLTALASAGIVVTRVEEFPQHYWPQFERFSEEENNRLPHSFAVLGHVPA